MFRTTSVPAPIGGLPNEVVSGFPAIDLWLCNSLLGRVWLLTGGE
jgi:hypothetical protein